MGAASNYTCEGSPAHEMMEDIDYDPVRFRELLEKYKQKRAIEFLYEMPLEEIGLRVNDDETYGYLRFRCTIAK
jgi:hypothetical protein